MNSAAAIIVIILVKASKTRFDRGVDYYLRWEPIRRSFAPLPRARIKIGGLYLRNKCGAIAYAYTYS